MKFNRQFCTDFAEYYTGSTTPVNDAFDTFLEESLKGPEEPESKIYMQVLESAAEMCGVSMNELSNGRKYGEIPTCKQITCKILHELKCSNSDIIKELPQLGGYQSIRSRRIKATEYEETERSFKLVLMQLRTKFNVEIPAK